MAAYPDAESALRAVKAVETALTSGNIDEVMSAFSTAQQLCIYSNYKEAYKLWKQMEPEIARYLYRNLQLEQFGQLPFENNLHTFQILPHLDEIAEEIPIENILTMTEWWELKPEHVIPNLFRKLTDEPGERITIWCQEKIAARVEQECEAGEDIDEHMRTVSSFQFIRWMPDDKGLSQVVSLLAQRTDPLAQQLKGEYLLTLPWGENRSATRALLTGLSHERTERSRVLLEAALDQYSNPTSTRLAVLDAFFRHAPEQALHLGIEDLQRVQDDSGRYAYIGWLDAKLSPSIYFPELIPPFMDETIQQKLQDLDVSRWSIFVRGPFRQFLRERAPAVTPPPASAVVDTFVHNTISAFENLRVEHMSSVIVLPIFAFLGVGLFLVLNLVLGRPNPDFAFAQGAALTNWVLAAAATAHTHFSGRESREDRFTMALYYFGSALAVPVTAVWIRI